MNLIKKAGNYCISGLNTFFLLTLTVLLFSSCSNLLDKNESYNIGFKDGYLKGYSEAIIKKEKEAAEQAKKEKIAEKPANKLPGNTESVAPAENSSVPQKAIAVLQYIRANNKAPEGYVGGRHFGNYEQNLPERDQTGKRIDYKEWDIHPKIEGKNRGAQRIVTGSDGSAWYTADHYQSFTEIK